LTWLPDQQQGRHLSWQSPGREARAIGAELLTTFGDADLRFGVSAPGGWVLKQRTGTSWDYDLSRIAACPGGTALWGICTGVADPAGGIAAPICLVSGLALLLAGSASLLLNLEAVFTMGIAVLIGREHLSGKGTAATALSITGALVIGGGTASGTTLHGGRGAPGDWWCDRQPDKTPKPSGADPAVPLRGNGIGDHGRSLELAPERVWQKDQQKV
jgi:hypothetical protein